VPSERLLQLCESSRLSKAVADGPASDQGPSGVICKSRRSGLSQDQEVHAQAEAETNRITAICMCSTLVTNAGHESLQKRKVPDLER